MILWAIKAFIAVTCPFTSKIGSALNVLAIIADVVFVVLLLFFAPHWWYALIALAITFVIMKFVPRLNPYDFGSIARLYSSIGSHISPILTVCMYLDLFHVI